MIAHPFQYAAPDTLDAAFAMLAGRSDARVLGGGTVLVALMGLGDVQTSLVLDTRNLPLSGIRPRHDGLSIGAAASYNAIEGSPLVRDTAPLLAHVCRQITGGRQITNQATAGGAACYSNPASDIPACIVALNACMRLGSVAGVRAVPAADFFTGAFKTDRRDDEMLLEIVVPASNWTRFGYIKQKHATSSWPIVTAACLADGEGNIRVAVGGAASRPYIVEILVREGELPSDSARRIGERAREMLTEPWSDALAPAQYRQRIVRPVVERAVRQALDGQPL